MYVLCVFVIIIICETVDGAAGKALLCRDPDTGKFYGVNTTWPSTTFCGNYHCKLRKKNITRTEYVPSRQLNLSEHDLEMKIPQQDQLFYSMFKKVTPKEEYNLADIYTIKDKKSNLPAPEKVSKEDNDRYLNENEIKSISSILHTLKKSDLDAIIAIYNLAQDIYKEIDKPNQNNLLTEDIKNIKQNVANKLKKHNDNKISYWYEPERGDKRFETDTVDIRIVDTTKTKDTSKETLTSTTAKPLVNPNSITDTNLKNKDFTKLTYYYPMTAFQRVPSYIHPPVTYISPYIPLPLKSQQETSKYQKIINPSFYLPYPFSYIPHHNKTQYENIYSNNLLNFDDNSKPKQPINKAVLINPDLENMPGISIEKVNNTNKEIELIKTPERITKIKYNHDWQTDPISAQILNEVRANADKKLLRPISLRKKITLERVGKVLNVDEITKRAKRSLVEEVNDQTDDYEVYVEKTMCYANSTEPGYFRYGNMSQPFPNCCPQKIS